MPPISYLKASNLPFKVLSGKDKLHWAATLIVATVLPLYGIYSLFDETGGEKTNERVRIELSQRERNLEISGRQEFQGDKNPHAIQNQMAGLDAIERRGSLKSIDRRESKTGPVLIQRTE